MFFFMEIYWASYLNVWPFQDKTITVFFHKWKFLIKSPIWIWKSFLFFDWPIYALYKKSDRKILNIKSDKWFVKLLFRVEDQDYLIIRNLKKSLENSATSQLFKVNEWIIEKILTYNEKTLYFDIDLEDLIKNNIEEIPFKNDIDLNKILKDVIPPKSVFESISFLMQDSVNIFELQAQNRIDILKTIFWLLKMDEAKDIIKDEKNDTKSLITSKKDIESFEQKLKNYIKNLEIIIEKSKNIKKLESLISTIPDSLNNIFFIKDKLSIDWLDFDNFEYGWFEKINNEIIKNQHEYQKILWKKENIEKQIYDAKKQYEDNNKNIELFQKKIINIEQKLKDIDTDILNQKKTLSKKISNDISQLENSFSKSILDSFLLKKNILTGFDGNSWNINIFFVKTLIDFLKQKGKILRWNIENIELKIKNIESEENELKNKLDDLDYKKEWTNSNISVKNHIVFLKKDIQKNIDSFFNSKKTFKSQLEDLLNDKKNYELEISELEKKINSQQIFLCDKIWENCPFISQINEKNISYLNEQLQTKNKRFLKINEKIEELNKKILEIKKNIKNEEEKIKNIEKNPESFLSEVLSNLEEKITFVKNQIKEKNFVETKKILESEKNNIKSQIETILKFMKDIEREKIDDNFSRFQELINEKKLLEKEIINLEEEQKKIDEYKDTKQKINIEKENILLQNKTLQEKIGKLNEDNSFFEKEINLNYKNISEFWNLSNLITQTIENLNVLKNDYLKNKTQIKILEDKFKVLKNLYNIFSKDLFLFILQDKLPTLEEIINNYLVKVVDFQISLKLNIKWKTAKKLELDVKIKDEKWERDVKTLSWGQKVILKLVRMLAISVYMNSKILFLDETINNLDYSTITNVTKMLEDFTKQREIKFYVITHDVQIREMGIWDNILDLEDLLFQKKI